jgi:outer membrane protein assembly factor BamB
MGGKGDVTGSHRAWMRDDTGSFVPTPAVADGRLYVVQDLGQLDCIDAASGKTLFSTESPRSKSRFYSSPVIAGDKLYTVREDGMVFVWKVDEGFELLAENDMGEKILASPVLVDGRILLRGEENLFCIGE